MIESRAASVIFLPAYSPDFNPIEEAFAKIKAILKKMAARGREALIEAIGIALWKRLGGRSLGDGLPTVGT